MHGDGDGDSGPQIYLLVCLSAFSLSACLSGRGLSWWWWCSFEQKMRGKPMSSSTFSLVLPKRMVVVVWEWASVLQ